MARFLRTETNSGGGHSVLHPPVVVNPAAVFVAHPVTVNLAGSPLHRRRKAKSSLPKILPVNPPDNFGGPRVRLTKPLDRVPPVRSRLRPPAVVTPFAAPLARPIKVTLVRIRPQPTDASVFKPAVINANAGALGGTGIWLVQPPRQARKTTSKLFGFIPPYIPPVLYPISVTLAPQKRGTPKSRLRPPAIQTYLAVPSLVSLFPLTNRVPAVHSKLRPPEIPVKPPFAPLAVHLTYSRRGKPKSKLSPPAWTRSFGEIKVTLAPQRRGVPKSILHPPAIETQIAVPSLVSLFPLTGRVPQFYSKLSEPTVVAPPVVFYARPVQVELTYSRRGAPKSFLRPVIYDANIFEPIQGYLLPRVNVPAVHSKLAPPATLQAAAVLYAVSVTLAPSRRPVAKSRLLPAPSAFQPVGEVKVTLAYSVRGKPKSRLKPPTVVGPVLARAIDVTLAPQRRGKPKSRLLPVPAAFRPVGEVKVTLAYSLRGKPKSRLSPPTVVFPFFARKTEITLVRIRPVPTTHFLRPPADLVDAADLGYVRVHLAPSTRGKPKSRLAPPAVVAPVLARAIAVHLAPQRRGAPKSILRPPVPPETFRGLLTHLTYSVRGKPRSFFTKALVVNLAVEIYGPEVTTVRIRPARTMWNLGPMGPPAIVYAPIRTHLAYSVRGKAKSKLPQASLYQPIAKAEYDLKITLAPQRRGKPKSKLRPPTRVNPATPYFRKLPVTLAPQKRGKAKSRLFPPTVVARFVARPAIISLAPSRFPRPKSKLLGVIYAAKVYAPIKVSLAPSRFPVPKSRLLPPAVVNAAFIQINPTVQLVRIRPPKTTYRLRPPAVVGAGVYFRGIQVHLAYSLRGKPKSRLGYTAVAIEVCYGGAVCGFDFAPEVCGTDVGAQVIGDTTNSSNVSGSDAAATVEGASAPGGSVTGDDARREGC